MIELNETLIRKGTVLGDFAQNSIKGSPLRLTQILRCRSGLLLCLETLGEIVGKLAQKNGKGVKK